MTLACRLFRLALLAAIPLAFTLRSSGARAGGITDFVILGGMSLSSPRTASGINYSSFTGIAAGFGFDFKPKGYLAFDTELLFVNRRYAGTASMPTLMLPVIGRFENKFFFLGVGPYLALIMSVSADNGLASDLGNFSMVDLGGVFDAGFKLPLTTTMSGFFDGRITRALTSSYADPSAGTFYWGQITALAGIQMKIGVKQAKTTF